MPPPPRAGRNDQPFGDTERERLGKALSHTFSKSEQHVPTRKACNCRALPAARGSGHRRPRSVQSAKISRRIDC